MSILQEMLAAAELAGVPVSALRHATAALPFNVPRNGGDSASFIVPQGYCFLSTEIEADAAPIDTTPEPDLAILGERQSGFYAELVKVAITVDGNTYPARVGRHLLGEGLLVFPAGTVSVVVTHAEPSEYASLDTSTDLLVNITFRGFLLPEEARDTLASHQSTRL